MSESPRCDSSPGVGRVNHAMASRRSARIRGFSLLELLVVVGLIAVLSAVFIGGMGGGKSFALQAGQSVVSNLVSAARSRALANGNPTRLLLNTEVTVIATPSRFLRYLILQEQTSSGEWVTVTELFLPDNVYLLPRTPDAALLSDPGKWQTERATNLRSLAFAINSVTATINAPYPEQWSALNFAADGRPKFDHDPATASEPRGLILTGGRVLPPGSPQPLVFDNAENVRGLTLSNYGVPILINERSGF